MTIIINKDQNAQALAGRLIWHEIAFEYKCVDHKHHFILESKPDFIESYLKDDQIAT